MLTCPNCQEAMKKLYRSEAYYCKKCDAAWRLVKEFNDYQKKSYVE